MSTTVRGRRALQWALGISAAIPAVSSVQELAQGPRGVPGAPAITNPTVDSSLRYANVFKLAWSGVIWSQLGRAERSPATTWSLITMFVGGLARVAAWRQTGRPHPVSIIALGLELVMPPALLSWRRRVAARSSRTSA